MHDKSVADDSSSPDFFAASVMAALAMVALIAAWVFYDLFFGDACPNGDDSYKRAYVGVFPLLPVILGVLSILGFLLTRFLFWLGKLSRISLFVVSFAVSLLPSVWSGMVQQNQLGTYQGWISVAVTLVIFNLLGGIYVFVWWRVAHA